MKRRLLTILLIVIVLAIWASVGLLALERQRVQQRDTYLLDPNEPTPACMGTTCIEAGTTPITGTLEPLINPNFGPQP